MCIPLFKTSTLFHIMNSFSISSTLLLHASDYRYCLGNLWVLRTSVLMRRGAGNLMEGYSCGSTPPVEEEAPVETLGWQDLPMFRAM